MIPYPISEEKLNQLANSVTQRLADSHYFQQGAIDGQTLQQFSDHEQINRFLLFQVYQVWQLQLNRFRHPYFNFEQEEVKQAMDQLQNLLSQHISIKEKEFKPLLRKAVFNNLRLLFSPKSTLTHFFFDREKEISTDRYSRYLPFFSDFDFAVNAVHRNHEKKGHSTIERSAFEQTLGQLFGLYEEKTGESIDAYCQQRILALTNRQMEEILEEDRKEIAEREADAARRSAEEAKQREAEAERQRQEAEAQAKAEREAAEQQARQKQEEEAARRRAETNFFDRLTPKEPTVSLSDMNLEERASGADQPTAAAPADQRGTDESEKMIHVEVEAATDSHESAVNEGNVTSSKDTPSKSSAGESSGVFEHAAPKTESFPEGEDDRPSQRQTRFPSDSDQPQKGEDRPRNTLDRVKGGESKTQADRLTEAAGEASKTVLSRFEKASDTDEKKEAEADSERSKSARRSGSLVDRYLRRSSKEKEEAKGEDETLSDAPKPTRTVAETIAHSEAEAGNVRSIPITDGETDEGPKDKSENKGTLLDRLRGKKEDSSDQDQGTGSSSTEGPRTVAERISTESADRSAPPLGNVPGTRIDPDDIPIHKQYQFVNKVFGGNNVRFRIIIDKVNKSQNAEEVEEILNKYVFSTAGVDRDAPISQEFATLMRSRYD